MSESLPPVHDMAPMFEISSNAFFVISKLGVSIGGNMFGNWSEVISSTESLISITN